MIYLVPVSSGESGDYYNEYILVNGSPELIGNTRVDLSDYYTREQTDDLLNKKQPVGNYITSVNGNAPDEGGNVSIDVQTYTAGDGIDISESGEIAVTNPMDDGRVSAGTTWSSAKIISSVSQPFSQSGSIITCYPVEGSPLRVVSDITAVQAGTGDPSPDNVRPISGWDSANLVRCGVNLLPQTYQSVQQNGVVWTVNQDKSIVVSGTATGYSGVSEEITFGLFQKKFDVYIKADNLNNIQMQLVINEGANYIVLRANSIIKYTGSRNYDRVQLMIKRSNDGLTTNGILYPMFYVGNSAPDYEPYRGQTYTADFGETVYGGTLDWTTGVLTVTWVKADLSQPFYYPTGGNGVRFNKALDDNYNHNTTALCSHGLIVKNITTHGFIIGADNNKNVYAIGLLDDLGLSSIEEYKTWAESNTIELYYKTNHPYTIQLTPTQILAISGLNTVYCDTGDVTVTGYEDPRHTVAQLTSRIAALESAATGI